MFTGTPLSPNRSERREFWVAMIFIAPWVIGLIAFTLYPICLSFYFSLTEYKVISTPEFIGFNNFVNLFKDRVFVKALSNTFYIVLAGVPITLLAALIVAVLLDSKELRKYSFFRVAFFVPTLVPLIINCILWIWLLNPETGLINAILGLFGIRGPAWLGSPAWAKPALIMMMVWGCGVSSSSSLRVCRTFRNPSTSRHPWRAPTFYRRPSTSPYRCWRRLFCTTP
jgi:multiple sugar transport system permease protein